MISRFVFLCRFQYGHSNPYTPPLLGYPFGSRQDELQHLLEVYGLAHANLRAAFFVQPASHTQRGDALRLPGRGVGEVLPEPQMPTPLRKAIAQTLRTNAFSGRNFFRLQIFSGPRGIGAAASGRLGRAAGPLVGRLAREPGRPQLHRRRGDARVGAAQTPATRDKRAERF